MEALLERLITQENIAIAVLLIVLVKEWRTNQHLISKMDKFSEVLSEMRIVLSQRGPNNG